MIASNIPATKISPGFKHMNNNLQKENQELNRKLKASLNSNEKLLAKLIELKQKQINAL